MPFSPTSITRGRLRAVSATAVVASAAALVVALPGSAATAKAPSPWSGYRIASTGASDGGFIGARVLGRVATYRLDPAARRATTRYGAERLVRTRTRGSARAAWILSKYGAERFADQAAAVDVATYALTAHQPLSGRRAKARLRQSGHGAAIRSLAKQMLRSSAHYAGPYSLTASGTGGAVGGTVTVAARVLSKAGYGVARLPVTMTFGDSQRTVDTDDRGVATAVFPAGSSGAQSATVMAQQVPEWRLHVRRPALRGASRVAVAGRKTALLTRATVAVKAAPAVEVSVLSPDADGRLPLGAQFAVSGSAADATPRAATITRFGPFRDVSVASCASGGTSLGTVAVDGDKTYPVPARTVSAPGFYVWQVSLAGDASDLSAQSCGGATRVRTMPTVTITAGGNTVSGGKTRAQVTLGALPYGYHGAVSFELFGPYVDRAHATCHNPMLAANVSTTVTGAGSWYSTYVAPKAKGVYAWMAVLPQSEFSLRTASTCAARATYFRVG